MYHQMHLLNVIIHVTTVPYYLQTDMLVLYTLSTTASELLQPHIAARKFISY